MGRVSRASQRFDLRMVPVVALGSGVSKTYRRSATASRGGSVGTGKRSDLAPDISMSEQSDRGLSTLRWHGY